MSEAGAGTVKQPDPMEKFREMRDAYLEIWSKTMIDTVNTEGYAQASGAAVDSYLNVVAPYKEAVEQATLRTLQQLNMPSSVDFAGLAGRFTNIEMQMDNMDAKLDRIAKLLTAPQPVAAAEAGTRPERARPEEPGLFTQPAPSPKAETVSVAPVSEAAKKPPVKTAAAVPEQATVAEAAPKTAPKTQAAITDPGTPKRTTTAQPLRRNARKGK